MKKHLLILASLVLGFGQLFADEVTFDASVLWQKLGGTGSQAQTTTTPYTWKASPYYVEVTFDGEGSQKVNTASIPFSREKSFTVAAATTGTTITKVIFTVTKSAQCSNVGAPSGTYSASNTTGTWTPEEGTTPSSVTFTTTNSFEVKTIVVEYTPGEDPDPVVEPVVPSAPKLKVVANAAHYYGGTEPFIKDYLNGDIYAYNNKGQYEKWGVMDAVNDLESVTTYEGKLVILNSDNCEYKYVDGAWKNIGSTQPVEITTSANYKNMTNYNETSNPNGGWHCRFGYANTFNRFTYDAGVNTVNPYEGAGDWEPYQSKKIDGLTPGGTYKLTFKYTSAEWFSWGSKTQFTTLPFMVMDIEDFGRQERGTTIGGNILAVAPLPNTATTNKEYTLQFVATTDFCVLAIQFGVVDDGSHNPAFSFSFADLKIESVPIVEEYDSSIFEIDNTDNHTYSPLAYIESTGAARENVFTLPYIANAQTEVGTKFQGYSDNGWAAIFSGRNGSDAGTGISLYKHGGVDKFGYFVGGYRNDDFADFPGFNQDITVEASLSGLVVNGGEKVETGRTEFNASTRAISLFANPEWDNAFRGRIYYCTIKEGEETKYDFKPVMRNDGVFGYYDTASKIFVQPLLNYNGYGYGLLEDGSYIYFPKEDRTVFVGFTEKFEPTVQNIETTPSFTWTSSDESIATVAADGTVTGVARGTVTITATDANSSWVASYVLTVEPAVVAADNIEVWDGTSDAILGSIRIGGDQYKPAYTMTFDSGHGFGDGNTSNPNYNVIAGVPTNDENDKAWYEKEFIMTNVPGEIWSYNNTVLPNGWPENPGEVYVRRYFKAQGELPTQLYMPAAHDDAPCEYYINGTLVWSRTGTEPGVNGWYEDEVVKLTSEQRALIKTDGTVNVFAYHVHQNWGGRYADGGIYGNSMAENSPSARFENNENRLRLVSAIAQAEKVTGIDADVLAYAKNISNSQLQDVGRALGLVRYELRKALSPRHNYEMASAEPADNLECWLYNVGAGQFLAGSNDWGTHASLDYNISAWPMILRANSSGENRFAIQTNLPNGVRGGNDGLGHNGYVDCGYGDDFTTNEGWAWTFEAIGDGNYRIIQSGTDRYLGMTEDERYQVDTDKTGADNPYNHWKVITREQFEALAAAATPENPADVSYYIHQNTFSQNDFDGNDKGAANADLNDSKWERNAGSIWNWKGNDANGDYVYEMWNTAGTGKVYLKQTIEGLPAGQYIVECTGYYRDGTWEDAIAGNARKLAYLYAGSEENSVELPNILEGANQGAGYGRLHSETMIADGCAQAPRFFKLGAYTVQAPVVTVGNDGKLEIGVYRDAEDVKEKDWIVLDNFRLYRIGQAITIGEALYATYVAPADVDFSGSKVSAFAAQTKESYVHLEPVTTVPAGTAVVVKADAAGTYAINGTTRASLGTENELIAATADVTADGTQYILSKEDEGVGFYKATIGSTINAGKGYLVIEGSAGVKGFYGFDEDATGINAVEIANENAPVYNVAGQRLQKMQKGINIVGGKKVLK